MTINDAINFHNEDQWNRPLSSISGYETLPVRAVKAFAERSIDQYGDLITALADRSILRASNFGKHSLRAVLNWVGIDKLPSCPIQVTPPIVSEDFNAWLSNSKSTLLACGSNVLIQMKAAFLAGLELGKTKTRNEIALHAGIQALRTIGVSL